MPMREDTHPFPFTILQRSIPVSFIVMSAVPSFSSPISTILIGIPS